MDSSGFGVRNRARIRMRIRVWFTAGVNSGSRSEPQSGLIYPSKVGKMRVGRKIKLGVIIRIDFRDRMGVKVRKGSYQL